MPLASVAECVMRAKSVERDDAGVCLRSREHVRVALRRLVERGQVRKIFDEPEVWWELTSG
jgi:hypothetical protein